MKAAVFLDLDLEEVEHQLCCILLLNASQNVCTAKGGMVKCPYLVAHIQRYLFIYLIRWARNKVLANRYWRHTFAQNSLSTYSICRTDITLISLSNISSNEDRS